VFSLFFFFCFFYWFCHLRDVFNVFRAGCKSVFFFFLYGSSSLNVISFNIYLPQCSATDVYGGLFVLYFFFSIL